MNSPMNNNNQQQQSHQSANYQNAQRQGTVNGIAQPQDPMDGNSANVFDTLAAKNDPNSHFNAGGGQEFPQGTNPLPTQQPSAFDPTQVAPQQSGTPMDKWTIPANNGNQGGQQQQPAGDPQQQAPAGQPSTPAEYQSIFARSKLEEFQALTGSRDFAGESLTPEIMEAFQGGDFSALPNIINQAVQQGAAFSAFMGSRLADKGVADMLGNFQSSTLPNLMNDHTSANLWKSPDMADFNSPQMQPMVQMATAHVRQQFPTASPQEQHAKALEMMRDMTSHLQTVNLTPAQQQQQQAPEGDTRSNMEKLFNI